MKKILRSVKQMTHRQKMLMTDEVFSEPEASIDLPMDEPFKKGSSSDEVFSEPEASIDLPMDEPSKKGSSSDKSREEMKWGDRQEEQIMKWQRQCADRSSRHASASKTYKSMYYAMNVPATLLPLFGTAVVSFSGTKCNKPLASIIVGLVTGGLVGVNTVFNFAQKYQAHEEYENRFTELCVHVAKEMSKPRAFRIQCDVYLETISSQLNRLTAGAPPL